MKPKFYLFLLASTLVFASCEKWIPENNHQQVTGNWELIAVDRIRSYGSEPVYTGYENGTFSFRSNEQAEYSDYKGRMTGTWRMIYRNDGYYDQYGDWQNGPRNSMELRLYDNYSNRVIEWEFYQTEIYSNTLVGYMNRFGNEYRYEFRRY